METQDLIGAAVRSVRTTFTILEAVADHQPIGLSELARRLELPKSTVQRSLATLADLGWIRADGRDLTRWTIGDKVRTLSDRVDDLSRLREAALPVLARLNEETSETIHLAVPEGDMARLVERQDSKHALRLVKPIGTRSPLHAGSAGKVILAYLPQREVDNYLAGELVALTTHTITDPKELFVELQAIRDRGYAVGDQELDYGAVSVAAAVRPDGGRPVAAVSISGPSSRITADLFATYGDLLKPAAAEIAANLRN